MTLLDETQADDTTLRRPPATPSDTDRVRPRGWPAILAAVAVAVVAGALGFAARLLPGDEVAPTDRTDLLVQAFQLHTEGDLDAAETAYRRVLDADSGNRFANYNIGLIEQARGKHDAAVERFTVAVDTDPSYVSAWFARGVSEAAGGDYDLALASLSRVLELDADNPGALFQTGLVLVADGEVDAGEALMNRAVELEPDLRALAAGD